MSLYPDDVPFKVVSEPWCEYDVGDNCILRTKLVLIKVLKPPGVSLDRIRELNFKTHQLFAVYAPSDKKGAPETRQMTPEFLEDSIVEDIEPKPKKTPKNQYELKNGIKIRLSLALTRVAKTDIYSDDGSPVIVVSHQIVPQIIFPKRKRSKKKSTSVV